MDEEVDVYMLQRWPKCIAYMGTVTIPEDRLTEQVTRELLRFLRKIMWELFLGAQAALLDSDQRATVCGYRREWFARQLFDICGTRRPCSVECYVPTEVGEPIGPGIASLPGVSASDGINEFTWTPILSFPIRKTLAQDLPEIQKRIAALKKHYNGYNELHEAHKHIKHGEKKAAVRSAASGIDAILRFYCALWGVTFPTGNLLPFDDKIETVLSTARKPSFKAIAPDKLKLLLYLYRARNSMHEGDCCYRDSNGVLRQVRTIEQVKPLLEAAESFVVWIDAIA